jgi:excisionase family DNA binding protein
MSAPRVVQRLALSPEEAAAAIGVSRSFFFAAILPELRVVRVGRRRLIAVSEIQKYLDREAVRGGG